MFSIRKTLLKKDAQQQVESLLLFLYDIKVMNKMRMKINIKTKYRIIYILFIFCTILLSGCSLPTSNEQEKDSKQIASNNQEESSIEIFAMDTYMTLKAYGENREEALAVAQTEIERLDALWSVGESDSEVSKLNREKKLTVSDETMKLLTCAKDISKQTKGAFDITIYPLMNLWGFTTQKYKVPTKDEINQILNSQVGMDKVEVSAKTNKVTLKDNAQIDLGGIAKGYTSSQVAKIYEDCGVESGVISLGGNVQAIGTKVDGSRWKVGIQSPNDSMDMVGTYEAKDEAVITSGGYERYFEENGKTYHHILDPATGKPTEKDLISVTVISKDGTKADCLSTTLFVLGKEKAQAYWKKYKDEFDMILVDENNKIWITKGIKKHFTSDYEYQVID